MWDNNVLSVELLTAEDEPRLVRLEGPDVYPALHTYGTVGAITKVELPLAPKRPWQDCYATFDSLTGAVSFGWAVASDDSLTKRLVSIQEAPIPIMFEPVKKFFTSTQSTVLMIVEEGSVEAVRALAATFGGQFVDTWPPRPAINQFVFSHSVLWSKRYNTNYSWLQARFSTDRDEFMRQVQAIKDEFGAYWLHHIEMIRHADGVQPSAIPVLTDPDSGLLDRIIRFCEGIGMKVHNPHSYVVGEGGMVNDLEPVFAFKRTADPYGLLNPGKMERTFYQSAVSR
jgi:FAD/FMN-containing dehydrogenase